MTIKPASFVTIGECMIELSQRQGDLWQMGFAGDTFNTAWYARALLPVEKPVAYVTAIGDDPFSQKLHDTIAGAGVETDRIRAVPGRRPGLYAITLDGAERTFTYWRGESAARQLADDAAWLDHALADVELIYFTGVTLAILSPDARQRLLSALSQRRAAGARIAFDSNYRAVLWPDIKEARDVMAAALSICDFALPTFDDEALLFGDDTPEEAAKRMAALGAGEIVVKSGAEPCLVVAEGAHAHVPSRTPERVVDTTGAGDSFAGAYLSARLLGHQPLAAAELGHAVASRVVGVYGALADIDREAIFGAAG